MNNDRIGKQGRFPANLILDETEAEMLDEQSGILASDSANRKPRGNKITYGVTKKNFGTSQNKSPNRPDTGGASRFFYNIKNENVKDIVCKHSLADSVKKISETIQATNVHIARSNVAEKLEEQLVLNVKSAINLCDSCVTSIAQDIVKTMSLASKKQELQVCPVFTGDYKNFIQSQSLVFIAEKWVNTGIIPTIQDLSKLFGCVLLVTDENINLESQKRNSDPTRFLYYCPKASKSERNKGLESLDLKKHETFQGGNKLGRSPKESTQPQANNHPTVKPIKLMEYLIKLVTPESGTVLDCFMGSGSTGVAAKNLGFKFIGIELSEEYFKIAEKRINKCPVIIRK